MSNEVETSFQNNNEQYYRKDYYSSPPAQLAGLVMTVKARKKERLSPPLFNRLSIEFIMRDCKSVLRLSRIRKGKGFL